MRHAITAFVRAVDALCWFAAMIAAALLLAIACAVFYEVVVRWLGSPTEWTFELTAYALVWCGFLGAAFALKNGRQVRVDIIVELLSPPAARRLALVADVLALFFCILILWYGTIYVHLSWVNEATSVSPLRVPLYIPQAAVPIGTALLCLQLLADIAMRTGVATVREDGQ